MPCYAPESGTLCIYDSYYLFFDSVWIYITLLYLIPMESAFCKTFFSLRKLQYGFTRKKPAKHLKALQDKKKLYWNMVHNVTIPTSIPTLENFKVSKKCLFSTFSLKKGLIHHFLRSAFCMTLLCASFMQIAKRKSWPSFWRPYRASRAPKITVF